MVGMLDRKSDFSFGLKFGLFSLFMVTSLLVFPVLGFSQTVGEEQLNKEKEEVLMVLDGSSEMPKPLNMMKVVSAIGYPDSAKEAGLQGKVYVRILVGKEGEVSDYKVLKSPGKILTQAVEAHIEELVFSPGTLEGKPVKVWVMLPINFAFEVEKHSAETPETKKELRKKRRKTRRK